MWPQLSRSWCSLVSLHQTLEAASPFNMHACVTQSINVGFMCCMQCKSMFSLKSVYLQPSKSHSLCIHTILDPWLVRTHHASGTCSCLSASAEDAPTVPQCRFHVPLLCSCNGSSIRKVLTHHILKLSIEPAMVPLVLALLIGQADCMHSLQFLSSLMSIGFQ